MVNSDKSETRTGLAIKEKKVQCFADFKICKCINTSGKLQTNTKKMRLGLSIFITANPRK